MKINVLGSEYRVIICHDGEEKRLADCDGFCDETTREIFVENYESFNGDLHSKQNLAAQIQKNIRHELIHAFLFESGLAENSPWAQDEELVDWIAIQGPKLCKAWKEAGAL